MRFIADDSGRLSRRTAIAALACVVTNRFAGGADRVASPAGRGSSPGHPLNGFLDIAREAKLRADALDCYSYTFVKRERIDGKLTDHEHLFMKVRNRPFSVYVYCLGPAKARGEEALYVEGRNDGNVLAHTVGVRNRLVGTVALPPDHPRLLEGNRYPVTNAGLSNLLAKVIDLHEPELAYGECDVRFFENAKVDGRPTLCAQVAHPVPRRSFRTHLTRMFFDNEHGLPIRWEAYSWPDEPGGEPVLVEEYTFRELTLNQPYDDIDFDAKNPRYSFQ